MEFTSSEDLLSLHFGRTFWLNDEGEFCSAPTYKDGNTDWERWDYVSDWDMEGVDFDKLFDVHMTCLLYTSPSPRDRTRSRMPSSA